ncbi:uncharacterized protein EI97DRAFT_480624 [Westerdykella ornata]|uniref:Uncharacterized protein n=1 Tax=Westerdykella ornata TaxID=318751 RepID=A0A6A6JEJ7_WESOR|nr:uncharacterized protein EI97DRAFT_480624 [Westerdykella ornata]KAF2273599.1 hypothetical protein EI97DRAFT_480624 [Westerdykella ornata]
MISYCFLCRFSPTLPFPPTINLGSLYLTLYRESQTIPAGILERKLPVAIRQKPPPFSAHRHHGSLWRGLPFPSVPTPLLHLPSQVGDLTTGRYDQTPQNIYLQDIEEGANQKFPEAYRALPSSDALQFTEIPSPPWLSDSYLYLRIGSIQAISNHSEARTESRERYAHVIIRNSSCVPFNMAVHFVEYGTFGHMASGGWSNRLPQNAVLLQPFEAAIGSGPRTQRHHQLDYMVLFYVLVTKRAARVENFYFMERFEEACRNYLEDTQRKLTGPGIEPTTPTQSDSSNNSGGGRRRSPEVQIGIPKDSSSPSSNTNLALSSEARGKISTTTNGMEHPAKKRKTLLNNVQGELNKSSAAANGPDTSVGGECEDQSASTVMELTAVTSRIEKDAFLIRAFADGLKATDSEQRKRIVELETAIAKVTELKGETERRAEEAEKRAEQMEKRAEQMEKRAEQMEKRANEAEEREQRTTAELQSALAATTKEKEQREVAEKNIAELEKEMDDMRKNIMRDLKPKQGKNPTAVKSEPE